LPGFAQQVRREIQAAHTDAAAVEERSRLPGAAPKVINPAAPTDLGRKAAQQLPVQGLVREFTGEAVRILPCDRVVTSPDVIGRLLHSAHRLRSRGRRADIVPPSTAGGPGLPRARGRPPARPGRPAGPGEPGAGARA